MGLRRWLGSLWGTPQQEQEASEPGGGADRVDAQPGGDDVAALLEPLRDDVGSQAKTSPVDALLGDPARREQLQQLAGLDPAAAIGVLRRYDARYPNEPRLLIELARLYTARRDDEAAKTAFERLTREKDYAAEAHENLGRLAERQGNEVLARVHYERALAHDWERPVAQDACRRLAAASGTEPPLASLSVSLHEAPPGFTLLHSLGRGGAGTVFLARDDTLDRTVAIKFLHPHLRLRPDRVSAFFREARLVGKMADRGVVALYELDPERHLIIMEHMDGGVLADRLSSGRPLSVDAALFCASRLAATLARAHQNGIVHRDIKPANVFFRSSGDVVLGDWGIASLEAGTTAQPAAGTLRYAAPEVTTAHASDRRADIYSLTMVLAEMLTGICPPLDTSERQAWLERAAAVFADDAPRARSWLNKCADPNVETRCGDANQLSAICASWRLHLAGETGVSGALEAFLQSS